MEVKSLRIGNLLFNDSVVVEIDARSIFDIWDDKGLKNYKPIPLTEEWLLRFGIDKKDRVINGNFNIGVLYYNGGIDYFEFDVTHIKHVHQLQNLYFALTGKELTIK